MAQEQESLKQGNTRDNDAEASFQAFLDMDIGAKPYLVIQPQLLINEERAVKEIDEAEASIRYYEKEIRSIRKSGLPALMGNLWHLIILIPALLVIHVLVLHLSKLYGWGFTERLDTLLDTIQTTLTTAGGGEGLLHMAGTVLWALVTIIVGITVAIPLNILDFLSIIIPDAPVLMGIAEGLAIAAIAVFAIYTSPIGDYLKQRKELKETAAEYASKIRQKRELIKEKQVELKQIRSHPQYEELSDLWLHQDERLEASRRKLREYFGH